MSDLRYRDRAGFRRPDLFAPVARRASGETGGAEGAIAVG
jgi:hypothetical protein